jgi:chemotaxis protein CheZ
MDAARKELLSTDSSVMTEMVGLADFIDSAKRDIAALRPDEVKEHHLPAAADELDEIVAETADATNRIMDATETIQGVVDGVDDAARDKICEAANQIFEACSFQDITGQRVNKVVKALKEIEGKVDSLIAAFGEEIAAYKAKQPVPDDPAAPEEGGDEMLLQGPQLAGDAMSQDEIDKLLNSA